MPDPTPAYDRAVQLTAAGGWRVIVAPRPESSTVALHWVVAAGGCHDGDRPGLSHLTERLVFRAPGPGRLDLIGRLEALGAEAGSGTTREYSDFHAVIAAPQRATLLALVPALARAPAHSEAAIAREKWSAVGALRGHVTAGRQLWDLLLEALWGSHPFARSPGGTVDGVLALDPDEVVAHHAAHYGPRSTVLAVAGACSVDEVRGAVDRLPPAGASVSQQPARPAAPAFAGKRVLHRAGGTEVTHVAIAVAVPGMTHPHRSALRLLDYVLGRGGSSRLYREVRERRALAYTCGSLFMPYADVGVFAAQAVCTPGRARELAVLLRECLLGLAAAPPTEAELRSAQRRYAGALHRSFETNADLTSILGVEALLAAWEPFETSVARIAAVRPAEMAAVAAQYLDPARMVAASIGPPGPE